jgi:hypothetical protein
MIMILNSKKKLPELRPRAQLKQILGVGIEYNFNKKADNYLAAFLLKL